MRSLKKIKKRAAKAAAAAFVILFINAWLQSRASKIVSGIA